MKHFYITDPGIVRDHNEDSVTIAENKNNEYMMVVADGMGGHTGGEIASTIAVTHLEKKFETVDSLGDKEEAINFLKQAVNEANILIYEYTKINPDSLGMGTTIVIALFTKDYLLFGNIGDSSGFVIKNDKMVKVTKDHTLVNLLVDAGDLTPEQAANHPKKNVLMKALGAAEKCEPDIFDVDNESNAVFLCSDGLTGMLSDEQIEKVLLDSDLTVEEKVVKLIKKCNARGGNDNISVAYLVRESGDVA